MLKGRRDYLLICGPCSAESEQQVLSTAKELIENVNIDIFRAGIWKSRTSPDNFEGVGSIGLEWLLKVKNEFNIPVATEIITPIHAEKCITAGIDYLWIGARTVVNPYTVKEIAEVIKGTKTKVMVKNPIYPDIKLWVGAITRLEEANINDVIAIHRGFYPYYTTQYRNNPLWEIPIELKRIRQDIKIICDPSHIGGNTKFLKDIIQQALDLEMSGLMIESHNNPAKALSDSKQQIKPVDLKKLLDEITIRDNIFFDDEKINFLRKEIDKIDDILLEKMAFRMRLVEEIGHHKKEKNITILQGDRSRFLFKDRISKAEKLQINKNFVKELMKAIQNEAVRIQVEIMKKKA